MERSRVKPYYKKYKKGKVNILKYYFINKNINKINK